MTPRGFPTPASLRPPRRTRVALRGLLCAAATAAWLAGAARSLEAQATGTLEGRVLDAETGEPVPTASVRVGNAREFTDAEGRFRFEALPHGEYGVVVSQLGYQPVTRIWSVGAGMVPVEVRLERDVLVLEGLVVQVDRLERRRRASGYSARVAPSDVLAASASRHARDFLTERLALQPTPCGLSGRSGQDCVRVRGHAVRPCVIVDDGPLPGGLSSLSIYRTQDLYRVEVYGGGSMIVVWTRSYMDVLARRPQTPLPMVSQFMAMCATTR
jgi:hypothetical protein